MFKEIHLIPGESTDNRAEADTTRQTINYRVIGGDFNTSILPREPVLKTASLIPEYETSWYEYVPDTIREPAPLVISRHGGMDGGLWQSRMTSWCHVADREGFIVIFPNHDWEHRKIPGESRWAWMNMTYNADPDFYFVREMKALIALLEERYPIDPERIYMQGHSVGDMMTLDFAQSAGNLLAGAAQTTGPIFPEKLIHEDGTMAPHTAPVPVVISFCENNDMIGDYFPDRLNNKELTNLRYWRTINGALTLPKIGLQGDDITMLFPGEQADVMYHEIRGRSHSNPFDDAENLWSTFFSGLRRKADGTIEKSEPDESRIDQNAVALVSDCRWAYINNEPVLLDGAPYYVVTPFLPRQDPHMKFTPPQPKTDKEHTDGFEDLLYAPVTFLRAFGAEVTTSEDGRVALVKTPAGDTLEIAEGNVGVVWNGRIRTMFRHAEYRDGVLFAPALWLASVFFGRFVSEKEGVMYINDRFGMMTPNMAVLIRDMLENYGKDKQ